MLCLRVALPEANIHITWVAFSSRGCGIAPAASLAVLASLLLLLAPSAVLLYSNESIFRYLGFLFIPYLGHYVLRFDVFYCKGGLCFAKPSQRRSFRYNLQSYWEFDHCGVMGQRGESRGIIYVMVQ